MSIRPHGIQNLQNYPKIQIDRGSVIKPCIAEQTTADQYLDRPTANWRKFINDVWHEGVPFILRCASNLRIPTDSNPYYTYFLKALRYLALFVLHVHRVYLYTYGYFFPYSLMTLDEVCDEFSRCPKWSESVIRAFAWHPNHDRCAVAICNDYIYVYQASTRIRVLRHNHQRKIVDLSWQPTDKEVLAVACQTCILLWRVSDNFAHSLCIKDGPSPNLTYLAPSLHLIRREKEFIMNGAANRDPSSKSNELNGPSSQASAKNFKIFENILNPPITSIQFSQKGDKLYACSPNSSKIAVLDTTSLFDPSNPDVTNLKRHAEYIRKFGYGVTKLRWSPQNDRLATATTSSLMRVFESFAWTCNKWSTAGSVVQDLIWSKPTGRVLLMANKNEPFLYALPFLDSPSAKDVGGYRSFMRALDLNPTRSEFGDMVGGRVQSLAWDRNGRRLAISFKDNPESILLYRTVEHPTVEFHQLGVIQSDNKSCPLMMEFHDKFKNGSLLTICWNDGSCQHVPLNYSPQEQTRNGLLRNDVFDNSFDRSTNSFNDTNSSPKTTPRSMTNFCQVSGNISIRKFV